MAMDDKASGPRETPVGILPEGLPTDIPTASSMMWMTEGREIKVFALRTALTPENAELPREQSEAEVVAAFRLPKDEFIGYFGEMLRQLQQPEPPRNGPCPCGSGKKYKVCHGAPGSR